MAAGRVHRPGPYAVASDAVITLKRAIAAAGGTEADFKGCSIAHYQNGEEKTTEINLKEVLAGKSADPRILPNDVIDVR